MPSATQVSCQFEVVPAGASAGAAIQLAKHAQRLPALLIGAGNSAAVRTCEPPLVAVPAEAVAQYRRASAAALSFAAEATIPLSGFSARFVVFRDGSGGTPIAVIVGSPDLTQPVPVRLHSACLTGDVFGSRRCDCGDQLRLALMQLAQHGGGIVLYLEQEGRGLGLANKIRAYRLQDGGLDTVDANSVIGFDDDERDYGIAVRMLQMLGCTRVRLMTNNPSKLDGLSRAGIDVVRAGAAAWPDQRRQPALSRGQGDALWTPARSCARRACRAWRDSARSLTLQEGLTMRDIANASVRAYTGDRSDLVLSR